MSVMENEPQPSSSSFSQTAWPSHAQYYEKTCKVDEGNFCEAWSSICRSNQQRVCIKIIDLERISTTFEEVLQEVRAMRLCDDPNIVNCVSSFAHNEELWLVTKLMSKGSCSRVMSIAKRKELGEGLDEECVGYILAETIKGLHYLHQRGFIHRDVRAGNILLDDTGAVCLVDFGVNRWTVTSPSASSSARHAFVDSAAHCAPEILERGSFDNRVDIWSLGITALELAKGRTPFNEESSSKVIQYILEEEPPSLKNYEHDKQLNREGPPFSKFFEEFYKRCLQKNSKLRPSAAELSKHKFLRGRTSSALVQFLKNIDDVDCHLASERVSQNSRHVGVPEGIADNAVDATDSNGNKSSLESVSRNDDHEGCATIASSPLLPDTAWIFDDEEESNQRPSESEETCSIPVDASETRTTGEFYEIESSS